MINQSLVVISGVLWIPYQKLLFTRGVIIILSNRSKERGENIEKGESIAQKGREGGSRDRAQYTHTPAHSRVVSCTPCSAIYVSILSGLIALVSKHAVVLQVSESVSAKSEICRNYFRNLKKSIIVYSKILLNQQKKVFIYKNTIFVLYCIFFYNIN